MTDLQDGRPLVFAALEFAQKKPERLLDAAFTNVGRVGEVSRFHPRTQWLTVATGPTRGPSGRAFVRAVEPMDGAGMRVVEAKEESIEAALVWAGLMSRDRSADAK